MAIDGAMRPGFPREKTTREWKCKARPPRDDCERTQPCLSCRNRRNRSEGLAKQRKARRQVEQLTGREATKFRGQGAQEENWRGLPFRIEVKSGGVAKPVRTFHDKCAAQSEESKAIGDTRPFVAIAMPAGGRMLWVIDNELMQPFIEAWLNGYIQ